MAELTTAHRNKLKDSSFGLPGKRAYPVFDRSHAANAKSRASQQLHAGRLSEAQYTQIVRKANARLGKKSMAEDHAR